MRSPFPGMDPYLERHWPDVHQSLSTTSRDALNERLPDDLIARVEERVTIGSDDEDDRPLIPDVRVFEGVALADRPASNGGGPATLALAPYRLELLFDEVVEHYVEIRDARDGGRLVTVVEFLGPSNKVGRGREDLAEKRSDLLSGGVNVVEIDLVRAGDWRALLRPFVPPGGTNTAYRTTIFVPRDARRRWHTAFFHPITLRDPLPAVKIPLRATEPAGRAATSGIDRPRVPQRPVRPDARLRRPARPAARPRRRGVGGGAVGGGFTVRVGRRTRTSPAPPGG